jgi:hypothetical protein
MELQHFPEYQIDYFPGKCCIKSVSTLQLKGIARFAQNLHSKIWICPEEYDLQNCIRGSQFSKQYAAGFLFTPPEDWGDMNASCSPELLVDQKIYQSTN